MSTFLAGFAFTAFGALLAAPPSTPPAGQVGFWSDLVTIAGYTADALLGLAALLFLYATVAVYRATLTTGDIEMDPHSVAALRAGRRDESVASEQTDDVLISVDKAYWQYHEAGRLIPVGITCVLMSLPLIGIRIHPVIGGLLFLALVTMPIYLPTFGSYLWTTLRSVGRHRRPPPTGQTA